MMVDGNNSNAELDIATKDEDMIQLVDKIRTGIIAIVFYRTAVYVREKSLGKRWKFHRKFKIAVKNRIKERRKEESAERMQAESLEETETIPAESPDGIREKK